MKHRGIRFASPVLIAAAVGAICWVNAGQLSPPAGPIMATGPISLNQQDIGTGPLFSLNTSGSYILTSDIVAPNGYTGVGIEIRANNVTLNMNGFALVSLTDDSQDGIRVTSGALIVFNISIYNGTVRNWGGMGVNAEMAANSQLRNLRVSFNGQTGIHLGIAGIISGCTVSLNGVNKISIGGILTDGSSTVTNCTATSNIGTGIAVHRGSTVSGCTANSNTGLGIFASDSLIMGNSSINNGGNNILNFGGTSLLVHNKT